jgi:hypothetical protein
MIARKSKFEGQLRVRLKKFRTNGLSAKDTWIQGSNLTESKGEIEKMMSLKDN